LGIFLYQLFSSTKCIIINHELHEQKLSSMVTSDCSVLKAVRRGDLGTPRRQGGTVTQGELGPPGRLGVA
jgi:hypothetical protein